MFSISPDEEYVRSLFELTTAQAKAWSDLEKAFEKCKKANLGFYNRYGNLGCFDKRKIKEYTFQQDCDTDFIPTPDCDMFTNEFSLGCNECADDDSIQCFVPVKCHT